MVKIKKKFIVIGVIVALILAAIIYVIIWSQDDSINSLYLDTIVSNVDNTGIIVGAAADPNGPGSVEGDGRIKIMFEDTEVYSDTLSFSKDRALKEIPYNEFVMENGDYDVVVTYKDKKAIDVYSIDWVLEYIYIDTIYDKVRMDTNDHLKISIFPLGGDLTSKFSMPIGYKTELDDHRVTQRIEKEFRDNHYIFNDNEELSVIKANQKGWILSNVEESFLIREEDGKLEVYTFGGLNAIPIGAEIDLTIYREGINVYEDNVQKGDALFKSIDFRDYDYELAGDYRFELNAKNTLVKDESPFAENVSSILAEKLNQLPNAMVGSGFTYNTVNQQYDKTVFFKLADVGTEHSIDFDARVSLNDGPLLTYEWDWDYFNPWTEENEEFDIEETGDVVSHSFYPEGTGSHEYIGLRVTGEEEVDMDDDDIVENEYDIVIIHIEFKLKI